MRRYIDRQRMLGQRPNLRTAQNYVAKNFKLLKAYTKFLYYTDYTKTKRWKYINGLITGDPAVLKLLLN